MGKNFWILLVGALIVGGILGYFVKGQPQPELKKETTHAKPTQTTQDEKPSSGFVLHIDAEKHFPADEKKIAHHYCKQVRGGMFECQLYDSDSKDARLVGVEVVVDAKTWQAFDSVENKNWHYHKTEIPKVNAKLPDLSSEEAAKVVKTLEETYGKIYLLWDPAKSDLPIGSPSITVLD